VDPALALGKSESLFGPYQGFWREAMKNVKPSLTIVALAAIASSLALGISWTWLWPCLQSTLLSLAVWIAFVCAGISCVLLWIMEKGYALSAMCMLYLFFRVLESLRRPWRTG